jgi:hypothetical protein
MIDDRCEGNLKVIEEHIFSRHYKDILRQPNLAALRNYREIIIFGHL